MPPALKRFVIVGTYRTGSSAVAEAISSHPDIACGWEWTLYTSPLRKISVARRALQGDLVALSKKHCDRMDSLLPGKRAIGYKRLFRASNVWGLHPRFSPALWADRLEGHLRWWAREPDIHIVHIERQDSLAWLKSKALADASGRYQGAYPEGLQLSIDPKEARHRLITKAWIDQRLSTLRSSNPYLQVSYESFLADNQGIAAQIVEFLGFSPSELPALNLRLQKQEKPPSSEITNLDDLKVICG